MPLGKEIGAESAVNVGAHDFVNALQDGLADCVDSCPKDTNNDADGDDAYLWRCGQVTVAESASV